MALASAIMGVIATLLPFILEALNRKASKPVVDRTPDILESDNADNIAVIWAMHDRDLDELL